MFPRPKVNFELNFGYHFVLGFSKCHVIKISKIFGDFCTTWPSLCQGLLRTIRHFENRRGEGPGDEVAGEQGPVHSKPEEFESGAFTLKTLNYNQSFFIFFWICLGQEHSLLSCRQCFRKVPSTRKRQCFQIPLVWRDRAEKCLRMRHFRSSRRQSAWHLARKYRLEQHIPNETLDFVVKFRLVFRYETVVFRRYVLALLLVGLLRKFEACLVYLTLIWSKFPRRY